MTLDRSATSRVPTLLMLILLSAFTVACEGESTTGESSAHASAVSLHFTVKGMTCEHCVAAIEKAIARVEGVQSVDVSLEENRAVVLADEASAGDEILAAVRDVGYEIELDSEPRP